MDLARFALIALGVLTLASCAEKKPTKPVGPQGAPDAVATETVTATATVQELDEPNRKVTIKDADGTLHTYKCGKDIVNFDQFRVGDHVNATVTNIVAIYVLKPGEAPAEGMTSTVTRAPKGAKPGMTICETADVTARVGAVDTQSRTITLDDLAGKTRTIPANPQADLAGLKAGDEVVARCTQTVAIVVVETPR